MTDTLNDTKIVKITKLNGRGNFQTWYRLIRMILVGRKRIKIDDEEELTIEILKDEEIVMETILTNIDESILASIPEENDPARLLLFLIRFYGGGNPTSIRNDYNNYRMGNEMDPRNFVEGLRNFESKLRQAGEGFSPDERFSKIMIGLDQKFYAEFIRSRTFDFKGKTKTNRIVNELIEQLINYYDCIPTYELKHPHPEAQKVFNVTTFKRSGNSPRKENRPYIFKVCEDCKVNRPKIAHTHTDDECRFSKANKSFENYYYDSGASSSNTNKRPMNWRANKVGNIQGISGKLLPIQGSGTIKFGEVEVQANYVPDLKANIVSGTQLANLGYSAVIQKSKTNEDLKIFKNEKLVATGHITEDNLLKLNPTLIIEPKTTIEVGNKDMILQTKETISNHEKFGHQGSTEEVCEPCIVAGARRRTIEKEISEELNPLEVVDIDLQGKLFDQNGFFLGYNVKIVDKHTGYIKYQKIADKRAETVTDVLKRYITRFERQSGYKVKIIRTDGGTEFMGSTLKFLEDSGIRKIKGMPYDHHFPPMAENAHMLINEQAKTMLLASKLPYKYYLEAMKTAVYLKNRFGEPSRFEKMFGKKPKTDHLVPFGSIGYCLVPVERRPMGKHDLIKREKCRVIGYGDDDESEEMYAYKVILESDKSIIYSNDVIFKKEPMKQLARGNAITENNLNTDNELNLNIDAEKESNIGNINDLSVGEVSSDELIGEVSSDDDFDDDFHEPAGRRQARRFTAEEFESDFSNNEYFTAEEFLSDPSGSEYEPETDSSNNSSRVLSAFEKVFQIAEVLLPLTEKDALQSPECKKWIKAMNNEMASMDYNCVWTEVVDELPPGSTFLETRWVFTKNGEKYKARLVAKGFKEKYGIDYEEIFAPVAKFPSIRVLISHAASMGYTLYQDDIKTAFLNAPLDISKWIRLPNKKFAFLNRAMYGLKEAPRAWYKEFEKFMKNEKFTKSKADQCVFIRGNLVIGLYVDDILSTGPEKEVEQFRDTLKKRFRLSDKGGLADKYLGVKITQTKNEIAIDQIDYLKEKLREYEEFLDPFEKNTTPLTPSFQNEIEQAEEEYVSNSDFPYRSMVGSLMYAMLGTRFDIAAAVSVVSKYCEKPKRIHCEMVKKIYYYLRQTIDHQLIYKYNQKQLLMGYCDASHANLEKSKSLSGYVFTLGETAISWNASRQKSVAASTCEAEYIALMPCLQECIWLKCLLQELGHEQGLVKIAEDNQACIALSKDQVNHKATRHIKLKYNWIRETLDEGDVAELEYIQTKEQLADIFTKGVFGPRLKEMRNKLGLLGILKPGENLKIADSAFQVMAQSKAHQKGNHLHLLGLQLIKPKLSLVR